MIVYVGCRTTRARNARGNGISVFKIDQTGSWQLLQELPILENPSYLALDKSKRYLYCVHGDTEHVSSFKIGVDGQLQHLNTVCVHGRNPVFLTPNKTNQFLFVATLQGGCVVTLPINTDGSLGEVVYREQLEGLGATGITHAHQCILDQAEEFLLVPTQGRHIGYERVYVFKVNNTTGELTRSCVVNSRQYSEPRHIAISRSNTRAYLMNEKGNAVTYYAYDGKSGQLEARQLIPSLPETYTGEGQASAVLVHPSDKFVYASNRIHESVACYRADEHTGYLTNIGYTPVLGKTPRFMTFDSMGEKLFVANEDTDTIEVFNINQLTGELVYAGQSIATPSPTCIIFNDTEE